MDGHNQKLIPDDILREIIPEDNDLNEETMLVAKCKKYSSWGVGHDRVIIMSTHFIYLLSTKEIRKKASITDMSYAIKSNASKEILLFFKEGYDMRLVFEESNELI